MSKKVYIKKSNKEETTIKCFNEFDSIAETEELSNEILLKAMSVYITEFIHRDKHMWNQNYRFFFASLVVMFLPNLTKKLGFEIPGVFSNVNWIFPTLGMVLALVFLYVALGLAKRFKAISKTYCNIIDMLPKSLHRVSIEDMPIKFVNHSHVYVMPIAMFVALMVTGIILIISL